MGSGRTPNQPTRKRPRYFTGRASPPGPAYIIADIWRRTRWWMMTVVLAVFVSSEHDGHDQSRGASPNSTKIGEKSDVKKTPLGRKGLNFKHILSILYASRIQWSTVFLNCSYTKWVALHLISWGGCEVRAWSIDTEWFRPCCSAPRCWGWQHWENVGYTQLGVIALPSALFVA